MMTLPSLFSAVHLDLRPPTLTLLQQVVCVLLAWVGYKLVNVFVVKPLTSPLRDVPGPEGGWTAQGHTVEIMDYQSSTVSSWLSTYGPTFRIRGPLGVHHRIFTLDPRALTHVLGDTNTYRKSELLRTVVRKWMSEGLITAEGERHKLQRKVTQRLFSRNGLAGMGGVVQDKANQLRDILLDLCTNPTSTAPFASPPTSSDTLTSTREIDMYNAACRCTFDIIGSIAIDHSFDSTADWHGDGGELYDKYERMQQLPEGGAMRVLAGVFWPWLDKVWPTVDTRRTRAAMDPLESLAEHMMRERQQEIKDGKRGALADNRDLLTLMLRYNLGKDLAPDQKLRQEEITGQLATFMFAGSDTTAGTIAFGLHQLALHPAIQDRLRTEILGYGDTLSPEQMDELPFLDAVTKEILRFCPSLTGTVRQAQKDDVIPLAEPVRLRSGRTATELRIRKGQLIHIPIEHLNLSPTIWGPNADTFNPSRFLDLPAHLHARRLTAPDVMDLQSLSKAKGGDGFSSSSSSSAPASHPGPGVWPNLLTFLDGPRRCIGYKLAMMEIKVMLFTLLREFEVDVVEGKKILRWNMLTSRPFVSGSLRSRGWTLPLLFRPYRGETQERWKGAELRC